MHNEKYFEIAQTILMQLGGKKFIIMTGSRDFTYTGGENIKTSLSMRLARNKSDANSLRITLDWDDTYTMTFLKCTPKQMKVIREFEGVYFDMLQEIFTDVTGLDTHL
ncbi:MAG: hypothetical protein IJG55_12260 [Synergistaceae bacterium]|nr:hypothetical protein [Synergistaceae bacterium]